MFLFEVFKASPTSAIALVITIMTLLSCLRLLRRQSSRPDRYLMGVLGLIAMSQGLEILNKAGFLSPDPHPNPRLLGGAVDMVIAALYLVATIIVQAASAERYNTRLQLRVAEANQPSPGPLMHMPHLPERTALAVFGVNNEGVVDLWHSSSEDFFGWRRDDVLGTQLPFGDPTQVSEGPDPTTAGLPRVLRLSTKKQGDIDAIVWFMPVPGESSSLVLVLDYRKAQKHERPRPLALDDAASLAKA